MSVNAEAFVCKSVSSGPTGRSGPSNDYVGTNLDGCYRIASFIWETMLRSDAAFLARGASLR